MKAGTKRAGRWLIAALFLALGLPYVFSRIASPGRCLNVVSSSVVGNQAPEEGRSLKVACYNIAHGRGLAPSNWDGGPAEERKQRLDEIGDLLRTLDADVVILNEVDFDSSWSGSVNQAAVLAEKAGYPYRVEERNLDFRFLFWTWRFGNAILSKYPIVGSEVIDYPAYNQWEPLAVGKKRGVSADIDFRGTVVKVVGIHLSHRAEALRVKSAGKLLEHLEGSPHPAILAGDFNSTPTGLPDSVRASNEANAMDILFASERWQRVPGLAEGEVAPTFPSEKPERTIDWILISKGLRYERMEAVPSVLSDHLPVFAEIGPDPRP